MNTIPVRCMEQFLRIWEMLALRTCNRYLMSVWTKVIANQKNNQSNNNGHRQWFRLTEELTLSSFYPELRCCRIKVYCPKVLPPSITSIYFESVRIWNDWNDRNEMIKTIFALPN